MERNLSCPAVSQICSCTHKRANMEEEICEYRWQEVFPPRVYTYFYFFIIDFDGLNHKVDTDCGSLSRWKEALQKYG